MASTIQSALDQRRSIGSYIRRAINRSPQGAAMPVINAAYANRWFFCGGIFLPNVLDQTCLCLARQVRSSWRDKHRHCLWRLVRLRFFVRYTIECRTSALRCMEAAERPECSGAHGLTITGDTIRNPDGAGECRTRQLIIMASPRRFRSQRFCIIFWGFRFHSDASIAEVFFFRLMVFCVSSGFILPNALDQTFRAVAHKAAPPRL